jgi:hypothetical protein
MKALGVNAAWHKIGIHSLKIISCDVGWKNETKRNAVAVATYDGQIEFLRSGLGDDDLVPLVVKHCEPGSLILLDIPIDGCENLECPRRPIEEALQHTVSIYPARMAGNRGKQLKERLLLALTADIREAAIVQEIYPYVIYKFLWTLNENGKLGKFHSGEWDSLLDESFLPSKSPPKYKGNIRRDRCIQGMRNLHVFISRLLGLRFTQPLDSPNKSLSHSELDLLADIYDACLGVAVGLYCVKFNPYAWLIGNEHHGQMLLLADEWLKNNLEKYGVDFKHLYLIDNRR